MAAQFDICRMADGGLVAVLSHEILDWLQFRQVAPLIPLTKAGKPTRGLNPVIWVDDAAHVLKVEFLGAVPVSALGQRIGTVRDRRDEIIRALDLLFTGV